MFFFRKIGQKTFCLPYNFINLQSALLSIVRTIEDTTSLTQKTKERSTDSRPIIRTATSRQGRRRKKSPDENKVTDVMHDNQKAIGALVAMDSKQAKEAAASDWSQHSSASEAAVSQGKMELLLVVRYDLALVNFQRLVCLLCELKQFFKTLLLQSF